MHKHLRTVLELLAFIGLVSWLWMAIPVQAHDIGCSGRGGVDLARCQRHMQMAEACETERGTAHFACDRAFLLAHPLRCDILQGADATQCQAELTAFRQCELPPGREFMRCVRDAVRASPMGAP